MSELQLTIKYQEFSSVSEMSAEDQELVAMALEAQKGSYSPYSHFQVGAALKLANGVIVKGANQENAAYPSGLCAERTAMFWAGANYPDVPLGLALRQLPAGNGGISEKTQASAQGNSGREQAHS